MSKPSNISVITQVFPIFKIFNCVFWIFLKSFYNISNFFSFWRKIASLGQASGPDAAAFSIKANIRLVDRGDGRPYFEFLDQNGAITGARISVYQAGQDLGPAGLELLNAMAGENKEPK